LGGTVAHGGHETIGRGGGASGTFVLGSQLAYEPVSGVVVGSGGEQDVADEAFGTIVRGGEQDLGGNNPAFGFVSSVGTVVENGGIQSASPDTFAIDTIVRNGGKIVSYQGSIYGAVIKSGGQATLTDAYASGTIVSSGGVLTLKAVNIVADTILRGGTEIVSGGGNAGEIRFGGGGQLTLVGSATASATLSGFNTKDRLDFRSYKFGTGPTLSFTENAGKTQGTLTITDGGLSATVTLFGNYIAAGFHLANDGAGGTAVTYSAGGAAAHPDLAAGHV